jgi:lysophospholipase L1-like esterase
VTSITEKDKQVLIVGTGNFNDLASLSLVIGEKEMDKQAIARFLFDNIRQDWWRFSNNLKASLANIPNVTFLDKLELFCNFDQKTCQLFMVNNAPIIFDTGHVTVEGARAMGKKVYQHKWFQKD